MKGAEMDIFKQDIEYGDKAANDLVEKQYKEHMRELKARIKSCSIRKIITTFSIP